MSVSMRILSVRQPWAHAILSLGKNVENRSWSTPYRGPVAIHASTRLDAAAAASALARRISSNVLHELPRGVIVGTVMLDDITTEYASPWAWREQYHWLLSHPRTLSKPIPYRGALRLGYLDAGTSALVVERGGGTYMNER